MEVEPKISICGTEAAAQVCIRPESLHTAALQKAVRSKASSMEVCPATSWKNGRSSLQLRCCFMASTVLPSCLVPKAKTAPPCEIHQ